MTENELVKFFEFSNQRESDKFYLASSYLATIISKHAAKIENFAKNAQKENFYTFESATGGILPLLLSSSSSEELIEFYQNFVKIPQLDNFIAEIILDSLADEARFRASAETATENDLKLFDLFASYHGVCEALNDSLDGMINAIMSIYDLSGASYEDRKMHLIKETVPVISAKAKEISLLWEGDCQDAWLIFFIASLKEDLEHISKINDSRFRSFFSHTEYIKIQKMSQENLQHYLASAAAENSNLKEAKNLLKDKQDIDFLLKELDQIRNILNITEEMLTNAKRQLTEKSKLDMEILKNE